MFGSGLILGALYDVYRVVSKWFRFPRWAMPIFDILYWIVATAIVFGLLYRSNLGQVRVFIFIALAVGVACYFSLLSRAVCTALRAILHALAWLTRLMIRIFRLLVVRPLLLLYRLLLLLAGVLMAIIVFVGKIVLQLLYPLRLLGRLMRLDKLWVKWISWLKRYF